MKEVNTLKNLLLLAVVNDGSFWTRCKVLWYLLPRAQLWNLVQPCKLVTFEPHLISAALNNSQRRLSSTCSPKKPTHKKTTQCTLGLNSRANSLQHIRLYCNNSCNGMRYETMSCYGRYWAYNCRCLEVMLDPSLSSSQVGASESASDGVSEQKSPISSKRWTFQSSQTHSFQRHAVVI
jgi:hypothetical protein